MLFLIDIKQCIIVVLDDAHHLFFKFESYFLIFLETLVLYAFVPSIVKLITNLVVSK